MRWMVMTAALALAGCADGDATHVDDTGDTDVSPPALDCPAQGRRYMLAMATCKGRARPPHQVLRRSRGLALVPSPSSITCAWDVVDDWTEDHLAKWYVEGHDVYVLAGGAYVEDEHLGTWSVVPPSDHLGEMLVIEVDTSGRAGGHLVDCRDARLYFSH